MRHIIVGLIGVILGLIGLVLWWPTFGLVMRGAIPFFLLCVGLIAAASGVRQVLAPARRGHGVERERWGHG